MNSSFGIKSEAYTTLAIPYVYDTEIVSVEYLGCDYDEERFQVSGGENTRINLARAFYLDLDIMLFDEITASLDKELSNEIDGTI